MAKPIAAAFIRPPKYAARRSERPRLEEDRRSLSADLQRRDLASIEIELLFEFNQAARKPGNSSALSSVCSLLHLLKKGSLRQTRGGSFVATGKYWVNNHAHILRPVGGQFEYWAELLCTIDYTPWISGAAQPKLTKERLGAVQVPCPPDNEQTQIADWLYSQLAPISRATTVLRSSIEQQHEYRAALITNAVTGKIDVRGVVAKEVAA